MAEKKTLELSTNHHSNRNGDSFITNYDPGADCSDDDEEADGIILRTNNSERPWPTQVQNEAAVTEDNDKVSSSSNEQDDYIRKDVTANSITQGQPSLDVALDIKERKAELEKKMITTSILPYLDDSSIHTTQSSRGKRGLAAMPSAVQMELGIIPQPTVPLTTRTQPIRIPQALPGAYPIGETDPEFYLGNPHLQTTISSTELQQDIIASTGGNTGTARMLEDGAHGSSVPHQDNANDNDDGEEEVILVDGQQRRVLRHTGNSGLVAAMLVHYSSGDLMMAEPVDLENLSQQRQHQHNQHQRHKGYEEERQFRRVLCAGVALACLILAVSLGVGLSNKQKKSTVKNDSDTAPASLPSTARPLTPMDATASIPATARPLPPLDNLELLYDYLPETTRESLYNSSSPQHMAWQWLGNHPSISAMEEWKKRQLYVMVCFYHSFAGPHWSESIQGKWMIPDKDVCSWVVNEGEAAFFASQGVSIFGPEAYEREDYPICNDHGEIQHLFMHGLWLSGDIQPYIPPEIALLTSLQMLTIIFSQIGTPLTNLLVPELIQLPRLSKINLWENGASGTIPTEIGHLMDIRHFVLGGNLLSGSIPSEIGRMTDLEYLALSRNKKQGLTGKVPSELGLLTSMTYMDLFENSMTGSIPSELGLMTRITSLGLNRNLLSNSIPTELGMLPVLHLELEENILSGTIPSELGLATNMRAFILGNNDLTGLIPTQLGLMAELTLLYLGNDMEVEGSYNSFSGSSPLKTWKLSHLEELSLANLPLLTGTIPSEIMMPNLTKLSLSGSPLLAGTLPVQICLLKDLSFDCSDLLCGCDCPCALPVHQSGPTVDQLQP